MDYEWKTDLRPMRGSWAPGNYYNKCSNCKAGFIGDKRAQMCADCAYDIPEVVICGLTTKGEKMPQTIEEWRHLYGLAEATMKRDKEEKERLQLKNSQLTQKVEQLKANELPLVDCDCCGTPNRAKVFLTRGSDPRFKITVLVKDCPDCGAFAETLSTEIPPSPPQGE